MMNTGIAPEGWDAYIRGAHIDPNTRTRFGNLIDVLIAGDIEGGAAAVVLLEDYPAEGEAQRWRAIEVAFWSASEWAERSKGLRDVPPRPTSEPPEPPERWIYHFAEGRRQLLSAICEGRKTDHNFEKVETHLQAAEQEFKVIEEGYAEGEVALVRGRARAWQGDFDGAFSALTLALAIFSDLGNALRIGETAHELAGAYGEIRRFSAAEPLQNLAIRIERARGQGPTTLARALEAGARNALGRASLLSGSERAAKLDEAKALAQEAYELATSLTPDKFRAQMAARDLAEAYLFTEQREEASKWLENGARAIDIDLSELERAKTTILNQYIEDGFKAFGHGDRDSARQVAKSVDYALLRLAEVELQLLPPRSLGDAGNDFSQIADMWSLREEAPHAVEAYLLAAHAAYAATLRAQESAGAQTAQPTVQGAQERSERWSYLALRMAERLGQDLSALALPGPLQTLRPFEEAILDPSKSAKSPSRPKSPGHCQLAGPSELNPVSFVLGPRLGETSTSGIFRVFVSGPLPSHRVVVHEQDQPGLDAPLLSKVARLSVSQPGLPRIEAWDRSERPRWLMDELVSGLPLLEILSLAHRRQATLRHLASLCEVVRALHSAGIPCVRIDPAYVLVEPGADVVLTRYDPLFPAPLVGSTPHPSMHPPKRHDFETMGLLVLRALQQDPHLSLSAAKKSMRRPRLFPGQTPWRTKDLCFGLHAAFGLLKPKAQPDGEDPTKVLDPLARLGDGLLAEVRVLSAQGRTSTVD